MHKLLIGIVGGAVCFMVAVFPQPAQGMMDLRVLAERFKISFGGEFSGGTFGVSQTPGKVATDRCIDSDGASVDCSDDAAMRVYTTPKYEEFDFRVGDAQLTVRATSTLDAGMEVGGHLDFDLSGDAGVITLDEAFLFVTGRFGELQLGGYESASESMYVGPPWIGANGVDDPSYYFNKRASARLSPEADTTGDANKITYLSPDVRLFRWLGPSRFGISYTPRLDTGTSPTLSGAEGAPARRDGSNFSHVISVAIGQTVDSLIEGVVMEFALGYEAADAFDDRGNLGAFSVGATVSFLSFEIGGNYYRSHNIGEVDTDSIWTLGGAYTQDDWTIGVAYRASEQRLDSPNSGVKTKNETVYVALAYELIKGFSVTWMLDYTRDVNPTEIDRVSESFAGGMTMSYAF